MSEELIIAVLLSLAGLLVPVPIMMLAVLTSVVQAYIFAVLTVVYLSAAVRAHNPKGNPAMSTPLIFSIVCMVVAGVTISDRLDRPGDRPGPGSRLGARRDRAPAGCLGPDQPHAVRWAWR